MSKSERLDANRSDVSQGGWDQRTGPIFWAALIIGSLLIVGGTASLAGSFVGNTTGQLILCSGLGILFGAFGSTATVKHKGVVITGVAAIAMVLLVLVDYLIEDSYVELEITGDIAGAQIEVVGDVNYLGAPRDRFHKFIIIASQIRKPLMMVSISVPGRGPNEHETEYLFECVHKQEIEKYLGSGQTVQWRFDKANGQLMDSGRQRKIADVGACPRTANAPPFGEEAGRSLFASWGGGLFSRAMAAEQPRTETLFRQLDASSAYTRRTARTSLVKKGAFRPSNRCWSPWRTRAHRIAAVSESLSP